MAGEGGAESRRSHAQRRTRAGRSHLSGSAGDRPRGHDQWRRDLRWDAYAAFLTGLGAAVHTAERLAGEAAHLVLAGCVRELEDVVASLYDALSVVQLEGPPPKPLPTRLIQSRCASLSG
ncbi:hypothetical protein GCM10010271_72920 [Streptomyces kurssanovii]|nr:hypothetical protein GCM10010271_72920 [Streptomyces kurssanovii]